jgi:hypothetical protein
MPGIKFVVRDRQSKAVLASFGPLAKVHVKRRAGASSEKQLEPIAIVVDGKELLVDPAAWSSLPLSHVETDRPSPSSAPAERSHRERLCTS